MAPERDGDNMATVRSAAAALGASAAVTDVLDSEALKGWVKWVRRLGWFSSVQTGLVRGAGG